MMFVDDHAERSFLLMFEKLFGIAVAVAETAADTTAQAEGEVAAANPIASMLGMILPLVLMFGIMYFLILRPQRKKDKQVKEMLNNLKAGDRVCTIGGIYGTITGIKDDTVTLAVGRNDTHMVIARWGIRSVEEVAIENDAKELN